MKLMILAKIRVIYTYVPPAHAQRVYLHSYYLPRDYWPLSVSLINITIFTPSTPPPPAHNPKLSGQPVPHPTNIGAADVP